MPSPAMLALLLWMWHLHAFLVIAVTFEVFALGRLLTTLAALYRARRVSEQVTVAVDRVTDIAMHRELKELVRYCSACF